MRIVWDEPKRLTNQRTHRLDFAAIEDRFDFDDALIVGTYPGPDGRRRLKATGRLGSDLVAIVFSPLGTEAISIVSLRPASRMERRQYESRGDRHS